MNHMRKHAVMIVVAIVLAAAGYMTYQRYYASNEEVQIQSWYDDTAPGAAYNKYKNSQNKNNNNYSHNPEMLQLAGDLADLQVNNPLKK